MIFVASKGFAEARSHHRCPREWRGLLDEAVATVDLFTERGMIVQTMEAR